MNKRAIHIILAIAFLLLGVLVYYYFKKDVLVYESYLGIKKSTVIVAESKLINANWLTGSIANWLPDLCWEISFLFMLSAIWGHWQLVPNSMKLLTLAVIMGTELVQMLGWLPGTGDIKDILVYFIGFSIFTLLFLIKRPKQNL
jgi:hypothetical protein